jgi:hypothetical protein
MQVTKIFFALFVTVLSSCAATHKIVIENDLTKEGSMHAGDIDSNVVIGFINWGYKSTELEMCNNQPWQRVSSQQAPVFSGLRTWSMVLSSATRVAEIATNKSLPIPWGLMTVYSQEQTSWYCSKK